MSKKINRIDQNINPPLALKKNPAFKAVEKAQKELIKILSFDVNGVNSCGIGKEHGDSISKEGSWCIRVSAANKEALKAVPDSFKGIKIIKEVVGVIRPL